MKSVVWMPIGHAKLGVAFLKFCGQIDITSVLQKANDMHMMAFSLKVFQISGQGSSCDYKEFQLLNCWRKKDSKCMFFLTFSTPSQHPFFFLSHLVHVLPICSY